jgi:hypothetical protein
VAWSWWQVLLLILVAIAAGLGAGYGVYYLIFRLPAILKSRAQAVKPKLASTVTQQPMKVVEEGTQPAQPAPDLLLEIERNHSIAAQPWTGNLTAFQTQVWDSNRNDVHSLPTKLREELTQAYFDMSLANSIVWLATELGRRSQNLDDSYAKLCTGIAERLSSVKPPLEEWLEK